MDSRKDKIGMLQVTRLPDEEFALRSDPIFWKAKAEELRRAALVIAQQQITDFRKLEHNVAEHNAGRLDKVPDPPTSILDQFVLLAAFALENLLKGLVLYKEPNLIKGGSTSGILRSHDLLSLANRADIDLSPEEHRLCVLASSAAVYWGRYPVSNSAGQFVSQRGLSGHAVPTFESLYDRVAALYLERFHSRTRPQGSGSDA